MKNHLPHFQKAFSPLIQKGLVTLALFLFSISAFSMDWILKREVPTNATNYLLLDSNRNLNISYPMPEIVGLGETLRVKILLPPGTSNTNISAQSNSWQCAPATATIPSYKRCPVMDGFDHDPGNFCPKNHKDGILQPCGVGDFVYLDDLHSVTARLGDILYPTEPVEPDDLTLSKARYAYFVLYQQPDAFGAFRFSGVLAMTITISDFELYELWRKDRSWAGGPGDVDGIGKDYGNSVMNIIPPINGTVTIEPNDLSGKSSCNSTDTNCEFSYKPGTTVKLTANPTTVGYVFDSWGGDNCSGIDNPISVTGNSITVVMNDAKSCTANFNLAPVTLTVSTSPAEGGTITDTDNLGKLNCGGDATDCEKEYESNSTVTLTAKPADGFTFIGWNMEASGTPSTTENPITIQMDADKNYTAIFIKNPQLTVNVSGDGTVITLNQYFTLDPNIILCGTFGNKCETRNIQPASKVYLLTLADAGAFTGWKGEFCTSDKNWIEITMDAGKDKICTANFDTVKSATRKSVQAQGDVNQGNLSSRHFIYGGRSTIPADDFKIIVTASVASSATDAFETLTSGAEVKNNSYIDINAIIEPKPEHQDVSIVIIAKWELENKVTLEEKIEWYNKVLPENMFNDTGWKPLDFSNIQYMTHSGKESYSVNVFTGKLLPLEEKTFTAKRVHFYIGYTIPSYPPNNVFYLSQPITFSFPEQAPEQVLTEE